MSFKSQDSSLHNETFGKDASIRLSQLIGSMSISPSGRDVVLGSKEGLHIIDLDSPYSPPRFLPHRTPWEVADVQWSPFAERDYWVVSTSNQKALVWNLNLYGWRNSIEHVLHGHTRAITDINFSAHHPDKIATCAVDSFVHCWDIRCPARPVNSFSDWFSGATQVKWSRQDEHIVASSHDKFLHIWDDRNGAYPARTIEAHDTKIYGIDWNRFEPSKIVTCSLDKTIKFWDTNKSQDTPDRVIETAFPVWRARHTPFGYGLMVMPQRGNGDLHLYDRRATNGVFESGLVQPVHVFPGHKGQVKEFLWRAMGTVMDGIDHRDFQLVTWGTDRELRLHAVSENIFTSIGYEKGVSKPQRLRFTRRGAKYRTFRDEPGEQDASIATLPRADSFPSNHQFLRARGRLSTTMGMSRVPVTQFKGWLQANKTSRKTDMHGKGAGRPDMDPISWMKSVKIASWNTDAVADEITLIGDKFKNVEFEVIDLSQRKAVMSLQSPWGEPGNTSVYTRLELKFPKGYPKDAHAAISMQRTNSISSEAQKQISSDIHKIAEAYKVRGRGCVEAVVRYLLREQSLDQIISYIMRDSLTDSKIVDEVIAPGDASDESDDDQIDMLGSSLQSNAKANIPPIAKECAALWADNGKLVCFFKQADNEPTSLVSALGTGQLDDPGSNKLFGGFGKFQVDSPSRKAKDTVQTADDSASETSDQSSVFSSSTSSTESSVEFGERNRFGPWQRTTIDSLQRGKSADGSQKSTVLDSTKAGNTAQQVIISVRDLNEIITCNKAVAQEYRIYGNMADACLHNCAVATRHAVPVVPNIWKLAYFVANTQVRNNIEQILQKHPDLALLVSQIKATTTPRSKSSPGLFSEATSNACVGHSVGHILIFPALMQFCEKAGDVQTLATLSAIYLQSQKETLESVMRLSLDVRHLSVSERPQSKAAGLGSDLFAIQGPQNHRHVHRGSVHGPGLRFSISGEKLSENSDTGKPGLAMTNHLTNTRPSSGAPSIVAHDYSGPISAIQSTAVSLAGSPESYRLSKKLESSTAFPAATASLQALTKSRPPSPPNQHNTHESTRLSRTTKSLRASPDDSHFNDSKSKLRSSLSLANVSTWGEEHARSHLGRKSLHPILKNGHLETAAQKPAKKRLKTKWMKAPHPTSHTSLVSSLQPFDVYRQCLQYMQQYIPLLEVWQLWKERAEMISISAQISNMLDKMSLERTVSLPKMPSDSGLEIRRCCPGCGQVMTPVEKNRVAIGWHCISQSCDGASSKPAKKQRCAICEVILSGLSIPCLQCGHLTCYACAQAWFTQPKQSQKRASSTSNPSTGQREHDDSERNTCPTGCGCACPLLTEINVPRPTGELTEVEGELAATPTTPRSEGYQDSSARTSVIADRRTNRGQSIGNVNSGEHSALNALLALNMQSRHRSTSSTAMTPHKSEAETGRVVRGTRNRENSMHMDDELLPWATDENASLGKGFGGGLSRGLSNRDSNSTIRKAFGKE